MRNSLRVAAFASVALLGALAGGAAAAADKTKIDGAAILEHPCGQTAIHHMGLLHDGKFDEAFALATPEIRQQLQALPAEQRKAIFKAMREMSETESAFAAEIRSHGTLEVEGNAATLTVERKIRNKKESSNEIVSQRYVLEGDKCEITS